MESKTPQANPATVHIVLTDDRPSDEVTRKVINVGEKLLADQTDMLTTFDALEKRLERRHRFMTVINLLCIGGLVATLVLTVVKPEPNWTAVLGTALVVVLSRLEVMAAQSAIDDARSRKTMFTLVLGNGLAKIVETLHAKADAGERSEEDAATDEDATA